MRLTRFAVGCVAAIGLTLAACIPPNNDSNNDPQPGLAADGTALVGTFGPAGGTLAGPEDSSFAGVALEIPEGALTQSTDIRIEAVIDPTPLPDLAERVGPQFRILPEGLTLAQPARLTVPLDSNLRALYEEPADNCKVWVREGDGWTLQESVANTEDAVSVMLPTLSTAAAGVRLRRFGLTCPACTFVARPLTIQQSICQANFCVTLLTAPTTSPNFGDHDALTVVANKAYYPVGTGVNRFTIVRYDLATGETFLFPELNAQPTAPVSIAGRVQVEADGTAWLGLTGYGNVRFRPTALPARFDTASIPVGVVLTNTGNVFRFSAVTGRPQILQITGPGVTGATVLSGSITGLLFLPWAPDFGGDRFALRSPFAGRALFGLDALPVDGLFDRVGTSGQFGAFATGATKGLVAIASTSVTSSSFADGSSNTIIIGEAATTPRLVITGQLVSFPEGSLSDVVFNPFPAPINQMDFGDDRQLYTVNTSRAEVNIANLDGSVSTLNLSNAAPTDPAYQRMLPLTIRRVTGQNKMLLVTRGLNNTPEFYTISQTTN